MWIEKTFSTECIRIVDICSTPQPPPPPQRKMILKAWKVLSVYIPVSTSLYNMILSPSWSNGSHQYIIYNFPYSDIQAESST